MPGGLTTLRPGRPHQSAQSGCWPSGARSRSASCPPAHLRRRLGRADGQPSTSRSRRLAAGRVGTRMALGGARLVRAGCGWASTSSRRPRRGAAGPEKSSGGGTTRPRAAALVDERAVEAGGRPAATPRRPRSGRSAGVDTIEHGTEPTRMPRLFLEKGVHGTDHLDPLRRAGRGGRPAVHPLTSSAVSARRRGGRPVVPAGVRDRGADGVGTDTTGPSATLGRTRTSSS
jgi:hypothetical protein